MRAQRLTESTAKEQEAMTKSSRHSVRGKRDNYGRLEGLSLVLYFLHNHGPPVSPLACCLRACWSDICNTQSRALW